VMIVHEYAESLLSVDQYVFSISINAKFTAPSLRHGTLMSSRQSSKLQARMMHRSGLTMSHGVK
jgi:hypothetical protein